MLSRDDADGLLWLQSHGGPLLLLDRRWLPAWDGYPDPTLPFDSLDHGYGRACAVEDLLGLLPIGPGIGLVLGDEPLMTAWNPEPDRRGGVLMRWRWADDEAACRAALAARASLAWEETALGLPVPSGQALLFDAAERGADLDASLTLELVPGAYTIATVEYVPDADTAFLLHRLTFAHPTS